VSTSILNPIVTHIDADGVDVDNARKDMTMPHTDCSARVARQRYVTGALFIKAMAVLRRLAGCWGVPSLTLYTEQVTVRIP
jgi:hypothetical protein